MLLVDELDRCRPTYAVQILEKMKHLFNVPNIIFVLAVDRNQLGYSIQSMYGQGMDVSGYLRRFIDLDFNLPVPAADAFCKAQFVFGLEAIFEKRTADLIKYDQRNLHTAFSAFCTGFGITIRTRALLYVIKSCPAHNKGRHQIFPFLLSVLIILKIKNHQLYLHFINGRAGYQEVIKLIGSTSSGEKFLKDNYGLALEIQLAAC